MANPQLEDGYTPIANDIADALTKINLSAYESRVLWFLFRKTYGWGKKTDWIALSQFSEGTGIDRRLIHRAIKGLSSKKMIVIERDDRGNLRYGFQKDFDKWELSSKKMTVIERDDRLSSKEMTKVSSKEIHTKTTTTKDTITKDSIKAEIPEWVPVEAFNDYQNSRSKKIKPAAFKRFFEKLQRLSDSSRASPEQILNQSIENGWQGIFELKKDGVKNGTSNRRSGVDGSTTQVNGQTGGAKSDGNPYPEPTTYGLEGTQ